jgi:hypothetical protein
VNHTPADQHQTAVAATLGPPDRLISTSKTHYRAAHPDHVIVFNANVCVTAGKLWHGDFDLTLDEDQLLELAARTGETVYLLYEGDGRFAHEDAPLLDDAVCSASPSGHTRFDHASMERRQDGRVYQRSPVQTLRSRSPRGSRHPHPPESPVLRLVQQIADHPEAISVDPDRTATKGTVTFADLPPDDQADLLVEWLDRVLDGWDGPTARARDYGL